MELLIFVILVLTCVVLARLSSLKSTVKNIENDQRRIRDMIKKLLPEKSTAPWTPPPAVKKEAVIQPAPLKTAVEEIINKEKPESMKPAPVATPPPLPKAKHTPRPQRIREPSQAGEILHSIGSWILVGDEHRKEGVSVEFAVATTWLLRFGIIAIVTCIGYFLKWSIEQQLLGPAGRTGIALAAGIGMLIAGYRMFGKKYHLMGQGFFGGGLATLYFSMYAAGILYKLVPIWAAFALMILITVTAGILSVRANSLLVAILGIIGGFCTPIMLSTGDPNFLVLYTYMIILGTGVFALSQVKSWRLLNYLSFFFTWLIVASSLIVQYSKTDFTMVLSLLSVIFALHAGIVIWHNISRNGKLTVLEIIYLLANSAVYSLIAYILIRHTHGRPWPSILTLALALFYVVHVFLFLQIKRGDKLLLIAMIALAGFYTTLTMPLVLEKESLTMSWALLALMFLWMSGKVNSRFLRSLSYLLYALVFVKLAAVDMHMNFPHPRGNTSGTFKLYIDRMIDRLWTFGVSIASIFGAFLLERKQGKVTAEDGDVDTTASRGIHPALYWAGILILFIYMQFEVNAFFKFYPPWKLPMLTVVWCIMGLYFLWRYLATENWNHMIATNIFLGFAALKLITRDIPSWGINSHGLYTTGYEQVFILARLLDFGLLFLLAFTAWHLLRKKTEETSLSSIYGYGGLALLFIYSTLELNALLYWKIPTFQAGGISILWAFFAVCFVGGGIWKQLRGLRIAGLILFAIVVAKVFLHDLADTEAIYRVAAFFAVGVALLIGAFAYLKAASGFIKKDGTDQEPDAGIQDSE